MCFLRQVTPSSDFGGLSCGERCVLIMQWADYYILSPFDIVPKGDAWTRVLCCIFFFEFTSNQTQHFRVFPVVRSVARTLW